MAASSFDPRHAVRFDLPHGQVHAGTEAERVLLVPTGAIDDVALSAPPEAVEALGRAIGSSIGRRAAARRGAAQPAARARFVPPRAGAAAGRGGGGGGIERWGRALVVVVEGSPLTSSILSSLVAAAVESASGRGVGCTLLSRDEHVARLLIASPRGIERVRDWIASGVAWGDALARLQGGPS